MLAKTLLVFAAAAPVAVAVPELAMFTATVSRTETAPSLAASVMPRNSWMLAPAMNESFFALASTQPRCAQPDTSVAAWPDGPPGQGPQAGGI